MLGKKGVIIPLLGTVIMVVVFLLILYFGNATIRMERGIVQKGASTISLVNTGELFKKMDEASLEIISRRAAYDLGKTGGVRGDSPYVWSLKYPKIINLEGELASLIKERLFSRKIERDDVEIEWGDGNIFVSAVWELTGDVNYDGIVDRDDLNICAPGFGGWCDETTCTPGFSCYGDYTGCSHWNWNPVCDLQKDYIIDISDIVTIAYNFGKTNEISSEKFLVSDNRKISIQSKETNTKIDVIEKFENEIESFYFTLAAVGRKIIEDPKYNNLFGDLNSLENLLKNDFPFLNFSIKSSGNYIDVLIEPNSSSNCLSYDGGECIAPIKKGENGIVISGKEIPYDFLRLNFRIAYECNDGLDNDLDGDIDLEDPDCTGVNDASECGMIGTSCTRDENCCSLSCLNGFCSGGILAFIANDLGGLNITDVSNSSKPFYVGGYSDANFRARSVRVKGTYAYVAAGDSGLWIFDISDPANPNFVSNYDTQYAEDVLAKEIYGTTYAFVADSLEKGVEILNVSDPANPNFVSKINVGDEVYAVEITKSAIGNYLIELATSSGLFIYHIGGLFFNHFTTPADPAFVSKYDTQNAKDIFITHSHTFIADYSEGLIILLTIDPFSPVYVSSLNIPLAESVYVYKNYAFVTNTSNLNIIDVTDISNPILVSSLSIPGGAVDVKVKDNYAYVAALEDGLFIVNVTDPVNPHIVANYETGDTPMEKALGVFVKVY